MQSDNLGIKIKVEIDMTELESEFNQIKAILKREGLGDKSIAEGVATLYRQLRQQRMYLLKVLEEKQGLQNDNSLLSLALSSALTEFRIYTGGQSISDYYKEFLQKETIHYVP